MHRHLLDERLGHRRAHERLLPEVLEDVIVAVGGAPITSADDLFDALAGSGALTLSIVRGVEELEVVAFD